MLDDLIEIMSRRKKSFQEPLKKIGGDKNRDMDKCRDDGEGTT